MKGEAGGMAGCPIAATELVSEWAAIDSELKAISPGVRPEAQRQAVAGFVSLMPALKCLTKR